MNRYILDKLALDHHLSEPAIDLALQLTGGRPDQQAWMTFFVRLLRAAGIGALSAGTIFFVAANWQDYGVMGRFVILQTAFFACVGIACWRPPPSMTGQAATILATLLIGALLALFGRRPWR